MDHSSKLKAGLHVGLVLAGAAAGTVVGAALTVLGKIVAGAPPATAANYVHNMVVFALLAAIVSPMVTWSAFRRVPLWRTIVEPLAAAIVGAVIAVLIGWGVGLLVLTPIAMVGAMVRLGRRYGTRDVGADRTLRA